MLVCNYGFILTGCAAVVGNGESSSNGKITIEPYNMSEKESLLISKTGIDSIKFFKLDGKLNDIVDLHFAVEVYEYGKRKNELLFTSEVLNAKFKGSIISFGINNFNDKDQPLELIAGMPSGLVSTNYQNNMTAYSFSKLIDEKVTLEKNNPIYLVAWLGTTKNYLSLVANENGKLPSEIEETELALIYKVLWADKVKK